MPPPGRWAWLATRHDREQRGQRDPAQHQPSGAAHGRTLDEHGDGARARPRRPPPRRRPRSSPSACSGSGRSQRDLDPVEVVPVRGRRRPPGWPRPVNRGAAAAAAPRGASRAPARRRRGRARSGPPGATCSGIDPAYVYGSVFATRANAARPRPRISSAGSKRARAPADQPERGEQEREVSGPAAVRHGVRGRPPAGRARRRGRCRPRSRSGGRSHGRARSARVRPCSRASADLPAPRRSRLRGSPSARGSTFVPPPGHEAERDRSRRTPFSTSLKPPSPEYTTIASAPVASRASSTACPPARSAACAPSPTRPSSRSTARDAVGRHRAGERVYDQDDVHKLRRACHALPEPR